ncbi:MAG: N-acetylmuramoyl-L-alanine amidase [Planctomycetota bacterium]|nr:MAG: N-acetylmuramoyl-L-alanine amidase [Planctomycetota bacterium]
MRRLFPVPSVLLPCVALLGACAAPSGHRPVVEPLAAPVAAPPGHLSLSQRIQWWEDRLNSYVPEDFTEANMNLGDLYLEARQPEQARLAYRSALNGPLSQTEAGHAKAGIGRSYLMEGIPELSVSYLSDALLVLQGPEREENEALMQFASTGRILSQDPVLLARLQPFLPQDAIIEEAPKVESATFASVTRSRWRPASIKSNTVPMEAPWRLTVHHSAEPFSAEALPATLAEVRRIQKTHQNERGWADIGYHFLIDRAGRVVEGRPLSYQGSHAFRDNNRGNIGICLLGNFVSHPQDGARYAQAQSPSAAQYRALENLTQQLRRHFGISRKEIHYHAEFRSTECPGPALKAWVKRQWSLGS